MFDSAEQYDDMLYKGLKLSGEDKTYFAERRIIDLKSQLIDLLTPRNIVDFGCGIGDTTWLLAEAFPEAEVLGVDPSISALRFAKQRHQHSRIAFSPVHVLQSPEFCSHFDLCYSNGVFHHIVPEERPAAVRSIYQVLVPDGLFALFENNPWNPGTKLVMSRIPFDRDAQLLSFMEAKRLLRQARFSITQRPRFLFYFPHFLASLRPIEPMLVHIPLGAQYYLLAKKESSTTPKTIG